MEKRLSISPLNFTSAKTICFQSANFLQHIAKSAKLLYMYCKLNQRHERWFSALIEKIGEIQMSTTLVIPSNFKYQRFFVQQCDVIPEKFSAFNLAGE